MKDNFDNIMFDIETLGTKSNSVILSIAAIEFDINTSKTNKEFYKIIDLEDSLSYKDFKIDASTLIWWINQTKKAKKVFENKNADTVFSTLDELCKFIETLDKEYNIYKVWGNSNRFDLGLLCDYFDRVRIQIPWSYKNERDVRTLVALAPEIKDNHKWTGTAHNALDDCYNQIVYCSKIWKKLKRIK